MTSREPVETSELVAFTKIVDAKSLSRAAADLGVPRATLGRRLARLEERLGVRLVRRNSRRVALTPAGETFDRHARGVLDAVRAAEESVRRDTAELAGELRVSVPPLAGDEFATMVGDFLEEHPAVRVQLHATTRHVDVHREGYDLVLRGARELEPGLVARTLFRTKQVGVASPAYLRAHGVPKTLADLARHRCLMGFERGEVPQTRWTTTSGSIRLHGAFFSNDLMLVATLARRGLGIAFLPLLMPGMAHDLEHELLVPVLPGVLEAENRFSLVYPERELVPRHVRAFAETLVSWSPALAEQSAPKAKRHAASLVKPSAASAARTAGRARIRSK